MEFEIMKVLIGVFGTILSGLATWGLTLLTKWLNSKIKNQELKNSIEELNSIITKSVLMTTQTFVDELKKSNKFTDDAAKEAFEITKTKVLSQLTPTLKEFIKENYGNLEDWLKIEIESTIKKLK